MSCKRYTEEFKVEAVKQVTEVASRIGMSQHSLYAWRKQYSLSVEARQEQQSQSVDIRQLKAELKRVTKEREILKEAAAYFAKESR